LGGGAGIGIPDGDLPDSDSFAFWERVFIISSSSFDGLSEILIIIYFFEFL